MIVDILGWLALADIAAAALFATLVYAIGQRSVARVTFGRAAGLAVLLALPAACLYVVARLISRLG